MDHVAIDLGGRESQVCRRRKDGKIVEERRVPTRALGKYFASLKPSRVIVETCAECFGVADLAIEAGHEVRVVPATLAPSLGVGARRLKTDQRDARALSEASCRMELPTVHIPSTEARRRKSLCGMRDGLVGSRTKLINSVRGWLRRDAVLLPTGAPEGFTKRVREHAKRSKQELPEFVMRQLAMTDDLTLHIGEADSDLEELAKADPICQRLMTVPGIGPVNSVMFAAVLDEVSRFDNARSAESYLGLTPGEHSSSERTERTSITKAGSPRMRWLLVQAAWAARRCRPNDPMVQWSNAVQARRGKKVATVALARKLAGILYAIWRDGSSYDPARGAAAVASGVESPDNRMKEALAMLTAKKRRR
jgi:transposase